MNLCMCVCLCMCFCFGFYFQYITKLNQMYAEKATFFLRPAHTHTHTQTYIIHLAYIFLASFLYLLNECPETYKFHINSRKHLSKVQLLVVVTLAYYFWVKSRF